MTTEAWAFNISHTGDAGFRAWGADFASKLAAVGLVQTADTGQINWASVSRPGTNTDAGYEIWRFDDPIQATAPLFIKFYYGTGAVAGRPRIRYEVGTASNGSGTLTGTGSGTVYNMSGNAGSPTGAALNSYMCHVPGFFGVVWGADGAASGLALATLALCRTVDSAGDPTAEGLFTLDSNAASGTTAASRTQTYRYDSPAGLVNSNIGNPHSCLIPATSPATSAADGADAQVFLFWAWTPRVRPVMQLCCGLEVDISEFSTFEATLVGQERTYLSIGRQCGTPYHGISSTGVGGMASMLWE